MIIVPYFPMQNKSLCFDSMCFHSIFSASAQPDAPLPVLRLFPVLGRVRAPHGRLCLFILFSKKRLPDAAQFPHIRPPSGDLPAFDNSRTVRRPDNAVLHCLCSCAVSDRLFSRGPEDPPGNTKFIISYSCCPTASPLEVGVGLLYASLQQIPAYSFL